MPIDFTLPDPLETSRPVACAVRPDRRGRIWRDGGRAVTGWLAAGLVLLCGGPLRAWNFNGGDGGTGAKFSLIDPAAERRHAVRDYHAAGGTRFGFRNLNAEVVYNLRDAGGRTAGFASLSSGGVTVYDQRPVLVVRTTGGAVHSTATAQSPIYPRNVVNGDFYRDYYFRPFKFGAYGDALGEVRYHAYGDRIHEVNALSYSGGDFAGIGEVHIEYPVAFDSYQVYEGAALTPTDATVIASGAVVIRRPNGSLLGFTFPPSPNNGSAEIVESGGILLVRHRANLAAVTTSIKPTQLLEWGRRVFAAPSHDAGAAAVLSQMQEELNPLPAGAFSVARVSSNDSFHNQQIAEQVAYDRLIGVYRFRTIGLPWGDAVTSLKNKYIGGRVTINPPADRLIHIQHESNSPDTAAVLQDANGHTLPVNLGIARSLGGDGVADWTGQFANKDMFTSVFEATRAWGRTQFPVRLQSGSNLTFNVLNVVHNWGYKQCAAVGSVIAHLPLATSNRGVWSAVDLSPWEGITGDFRGFSSSPTIWAWGIPGPGREEHFAHALEMAYPSIGIRPAQAEGAWHQTHAFSHFAHRNHQSIANGKVDLFVTYTELPETNEHRLLSEVEFVVNQDLTLGPDERLNIFRLLPNRILFYNAFFRSTADDTLEPEFITVPGDNQTPYVGFQTRVLEGSKPSFALTDKRWTWDPGNANPDHMAGVEGNFFVRVMEREVVINGQPANHLPLALRVGKRMPEGNAWDPWGNPIPHGYYVSYDLALEQASLALKAGDRLRFLVMIMPYGGRTSNNEVTSAQTAYNEYAMPELVAVENGIAVSESNPWLPTVRTSDGRSARFTVRGGRELLAIAAEGFTSYRPPTLFRIDGGQRTQIQYSVNGDDGVTTYLDASNTVGFSIPVDMTPGQQSTFEFVQGAGGFSGFDGGTLEGWTDLTPANNNTGPRHWAISPPAFPNGTHSGAGAVGQQIVGGTQDSSHPTLVLRSPEFQLSGSEGLTAWLRGGAGSGSLAGTAVAALPASSTTPGFLGIALRNVGTGTYQLSARRSSSGDDWQQISFTAGQLAALDPQATYTLDLIDQAHGGWGWVAMDSVTIPGNFPDVPLGNTPPSISALPDLTIAQGGSSGPLGFTVSDAESPATALTVSAISSNSALLPPAGIVLAGTAASRAVTLTPAAGRSGQSTITLSVSDGAFSATTRFRITVTAAAASTWSWNFDDGSLQGWTDLSPPGTHSGPRHWAISPPAFPGNTHSGAGAVGQQIVGGNQDSAHPSLVLRSPEFRLNGSGPVTARLSGGPGGGSPGTTIPANSANPGFQGIALRDATTGHYLLHARRSDADNNWQQVSIDEFQLAQLDPDGTYTLDLIDQGHGSWGWVAMDSVTVPGSPLPPNTPPMIGGIADQTVAANTSTGPLEFTVGDAESDPASLTLAAASSNPTLVPQSGIAFGGSGTNRSVTVTPSAGQSGSATITLTVSDGELTADTSFALTVLAGMDPLAFDFDDATLQGWTTVAGDPSQQRFAAKTHGPLFDSTPGPQAGSHMVGVDFGYDPPIDSPWDGTHQTMWIRSPEFTFNGSGNLSVWLTGGSQIWNSGVHPMTNTNDVPANSLNGGFMGIALRQVESGNFVALRGLPENNAYGWSQVTISAAELAPYANDGISYTLDFIDARHGGWGIIALDSVTIPGEPVAPPADPYADWAASMGLAGAEAGFLADSDQDGIPNGIEFVLGGQPNPALADTNSQHLLPTGALDGEHLVFTYHRSHAAAYLGPLVEFASDLSGPWTAAVDGVNATITAALIPGADADMVTVAIPTAGLPRLFARLKVAAP